MQFVDYLAEKPRFYSFPYFSELHLIERTLGIGLLSKIGKPKDNSRLWASGPEGRIGEKEKYCMCIKGHNN